MLRTLAIATALCLSLSGCAGAILVLSAAAATSELLKNECGVSIGATLIQHQVPDCWPPKPPPTAKRW